MVPGCRYRWDSLDYRSILDLSEHQCGWCCICSQGHSTPSWLLCMILRPSASFHIVCIFPGQCTPPGMGRMSNILQLGRRCFGIPFLEYLVLLRPNLHYILSRQRCTNIAYNMGNRGHKLCHPRILNSRWHIPLPSSFLSEKFHRRQ